MAIDTKPNVSAFPNPHLVQGSEAPVFRGTIANNLSFQCSNCSHILIDNYLENDFVSVEIKCFKCEMFTTTPSIENGEVFSLRCINMGNEGAFLIKGTVDIPPGIVITCNQALITASELTSPRAQGLNFQLSEEGFILFIEKYNLITGGKFEVQNKRLSKTGDREAIRFPFVWSIRHLRSCLTEGVIDIDDPKTHLSLIWLRIFGDIVGKWQHHPRFISIAKDFGKPDAFLHTAAQFLIAAYLYEHGNLIGLSLENIPGEANPDLYVRGVGRYDKIYLEVKSPKALHHLGQPMPSTLVLETPVKACIEGSVKQINRHRPGALVIFSGLQDRRAPSELKRCVVNWLNRYGRSRKSLAAVTVLSLEESRISRNGTGFDQPIVFQTDTILNPHFDGAPPIRTE